MKFWKVKHELKAWKNIFLCYFPGDIGVRLRGRYLKKKITSCGHSIKLLRGFRLDNPSGLSIGNNFSCNYNCHINAAGGVAIGNNVLIGPDVKIWSVNHEYVIKEGHLTWYSHEYKKVAVEIQDNVWIGANAFIAPGVKIGEHVIIGAGSVVTRSVPPNCIVAGNPAKIIKQ